MKSGRSKAAVLGGVVAIPACMCIVLGTIGLIVTFTFSPIRTPTNTELVPGPPPASATWVVQSSQSAVATTSQKPMPLETPLPPTPTPTLPHSTNTPIPAPETPDLPQEATGATNQLEEASVAPPTETPIPSPTPVPPTDTPGPPTKTPVPTSAPLPPTETPSPTPTPVPPTDTPVPVPPPQASGGLIEDFEGDRRGNWWSPDPADFAYSETEKQAHSGDRGFIVTVSKSLPYQYLGFELPGPQNFSNRTHLDVWVYGQVTLLVKVEDDKQEAELNTETANNPDGWTLLSFDFSQAEIDRSKFYKILFFPEPNNPNVEKTFFLDDIRVR